MYIYLIRHGQTDYNVGEPRFRGQTDIPLSEEGIKQAELIANELKRVPIDKIYYSPLIRAKKTAEKIYYYHPHALFLNEPLLLTLNFGDWQGKFYKDVFKNEEEKKLWNTNPNAFVIPNGETFYEVLDRIHRFFFSLQNQGEKNIVLVTHRVVISLILIYLFKLHPSHFWDFQVDTASITQIRYKSFDDFRLKKFNMVSHLLNAK
jgi:broad specificity phosphatase PhoE